MTAGTAAPLSTAPRTTTTPARPSTIRRTAVAAAGLLAAFPAVVWGAGSVAELVTGTETDHRFHQLTGQGVLLAVLWLAGVVPLALAGLRGRRPSTAAGLRHLSFVAAGAVAAVLAPGNGGAPVAAVLAVTGALLWWALPARPRLAGAFRGGLDVALAPLALLVSGLVTPFALGQSELQRRMVDEHAEMSHYFDMTWVVGAMAALALCAALSASARSLAVLAGASLALTGLARVLVTGEVAWSSAALGLGLLTAGAGVVRARSSRTAP